MKKSYFEEVTPLLIKKFKENAIKEEFDLIGEKMKEGEFLSAEDFEKLTGWTEEDVNYAYSNKQEIEYILEFDIKGKLKGIKIKK